MNKILKMAQQLICVYEDFESKTHGKVTDYKIFDFDQTWSSTALGFGGMGGQAITTERTYVIISKSAECAFVYFGWEFAYTAGLNENFWEDLNEHRMADVANRNKYYNIG